MSKNTTPENGVDRCECGCKYWVELETFDLRLDYRCLDCGDRFQPEVVR